MSDTLDLIQKLSNERSQLYRLAGKQHLTPDQLNRIHELTGRLYSLWDTHRREVASNYRFTRGDKLYREPEAA